MYSAQNTTHTTYACGMHSACMYAGAVCSTTIQQCHVSAVYAIRMSSAGVCRMSAHDCRVYLYCISRMIM